MIRAVIADDEPLAREGIRLLLKDEPDVRVCGEAGDGVEAVEVIERTKPDVLYLDVQMPELDGFGVLHALEPQDTPAVVFVTAHEGYALNAFERNAVDYLLKPIDPERFRQALARTRLRLAGPPQDFVRSILNVLKQVAAEKHVQRILVRTGTRLNVVHAADIDWIGADGDYACLHVNGKKHLIRKTLSELSHQLDPARFTRIHRSTIVNVDRIHHFDPLPRGEVTITLHDGTRLTASRRYKDHLLSSI